jgi:hypothetical protein
MARIAELHTAWSLRYGDEVPYVAEDVGASPTDLAIWQADRSATAEQQDELNAQIVAILADIDDGETAGTATVAPKSLDLQELDLWTALELNDPVVRDAVLGALAKAQARDRRGRFAPGGGGPKPDAGGGGADGGSGGGGSGPGGTGVDGLPRMKKAPSINVAAKGTNPNYGTTDNNPVYRAEGKAGKKWDPSMGPPPNGAYEQNCTNCAHAFEMRARGYNVQAAPLDVLDKHGYAAGRTYKEMDDQIASSWRAPGGKPHGRSFSGQSWKSFSEVDAEVQGWPEGGRGMMTTGRHVFNVVKDKGKVRYIEGQFDASPTRVVTAQYRKKYRSADVFRSGRQEAKVIRLDDLEPAPGILDAVVVTP